MDTAIKLSGAALAPKGKYKIFLESDDEAKQPMGAREIDADAVRLLFPVPVSKKEDAQELESRLHKGLTDGCHKEAVQLLLQLITVDKVTRIRASHIPTSFIPAKKKPAAKKPFFAKKPAAAKKKPAR